MAKSHITYVVTEKFLELVKAANLSWLTQSGFHKVEAAKGRRIYVAATKKCGRVDISNFEVEPTLGKVPEQGPFGKVKQQLRMEGTEDEVLTRFAQLLEVLKAQPAEVKVVRAPKSKEAGEESAPVEAASSTGETPKPPASAPSPEEARAARLLAIGNIKKMAAQLGKDVSGKVLAEEQRLMAEAQQTLEAGLVAEDMAPVAEEAAPAES